MKINIIYYKMSDAQFNQYNNLFIFAKDWRKYKIESKRMEIDEFRKNMQSDQYVKIECLDNRKNKTVSIYLFDIVCKYTTKSTELKKLLKKNKTNIVLLITYEPLNTYCKRAVSSMKNLNIFVYRHEIFSLIIPNGPLCYPHRIMSRDEVLKLTNDDLACYLTNLPKIFDEDPQCVWIGAEIGNVVEIKMLSDISGEAIHYRVVVPKNGRIIHYTDPENDEEKKEDEKPQEEQDDEVDEHREFKTNDDLDDDLDDNEDSNAHPDEDI